MTTKELSKVSSWAILNNVEKLKVFADTESGRYALGGILIDPEQRQMVATDSRTLIVIPLENTCGDERFLVDAKVLDAFVQFQKTVPRSGPIEASLIGDRVELKFRTKEGEVYRVEHGQLQGRFPDYKAILRVYCQRMMGDQRSGARYVRAIPVR